MTPPHRMESPTGIVVGNNTSDSMKGQKFRESLQVTVVILSKWDFQSCDQVNEWMDAT